MNSVVTLFSFLFILWTLSGILSIPLGGGRFFNIPGYMVYAAILYAAVGTWLTHRIGNPLVRLRYDQQRYEADFRFSMVRLRENAESIAFYGGESRERDVFQNRFTRIVLNWWDIIRRRKKLTWFTPGYSQVAMVFPFIVAAPRYFSREIQLGGLMQIASAFGQVQDSLSFIISSYVEIAEYRAVIERLGGFRAKVDDVAAARQGRQPIAIERGGGGVTVDGLDLHLPNGQALREDIALSAGPHSPLLITGPSGAGKSTLLRAVAGLWPFGSGHVRVGQGRALFLPQRPYLPLGTLQDAILYPEIAPQPSRAEIEAALRAVGLPYLVPLLDEESNWAQRLSGGEQQRIGFARVLADAAGDRVSRRGDLGARRGGRGAALPHAARRRMGTDDRQRRPSRHAAPLPRGRHRPGPAAGRGASRGGLTAAMASRFGLASLRIVVAIAPRGRQRQRRHRHCSDGEKAYDEQHAKSTPRQHGPSGDLDDDIPF